VFKAVIIDQERGGELDVTREPGLVLKLYIGNLVILKSADISHQNLHYIGKRVSLVFHMDKAARGWAKDQNGWDHNMYMCYTMYMGSGLN